MNIAKRLKRIEQIAKNNSGLAVIVAVEEPEGYMIANADIDTVFTLQGLKQFARDHGTQSLIIDDMDPLSQSLWDSRNEIKAAIAETERLENGEVNEKY